jgi:phosphoserine phosphatase RsbU/P
MSVSEAKLLVVDDVADNRELLIRRLNRLGIHRIDQAADGLHALDAIGKRSYDLVLLDIMMPGLDGFGVLEALRKSGVGQDLPVVVISAMNEMDAVVRCVELGAEDFLFKPFNPTLLRARVIASLEKKQLRDRTRAELTRKQLELNEARTLQLALAPPPYRGSIAGVAVSIDVLLEPAKEVGGDLVDHFRVGEHLLVVLLGDVSDKGAGAALMMARTHALFRGLLARPDAAELFEHPSRAVGLVNVALAQGNSNCMFVTLLLATVDLRARRLTYVRAGHIPPFLRARPKAGEEPLRLAGARALPLGLDEDVRFAEASVDLTGDDSLLVVTDGFTEAQDAGGGLYGEARVGYFVAQFDGGAGEPLSRLLSDVRQFEAGLPQSDDRAAVLLRLGASCDDLAPFEDNLLPQPEAISSLTGRLSAWLATAGVDARATHHVALAIEELLMNVGTHGGAAAVLASVRVGVFPDRVHGAIVDAGTPCDPRRAPRPDLRRDPEARAAGGLGLHLLRGLTAELGYESRDGKNCTTFAVARATFD